MTTIVTKNSSTASAVPVAGDLVKGELAINVTDKKVYTKDNSAAIVKIVGSLGNQEANAVSITGGSITGMGTPSASSDVSTKGYVDGVISTGAANAAAAAASASAAATSESNAATSASNASTSASSASTSASNASSAQSAAESARDQTLAAFDNFDDRYLGTKTADPTLDNDGNALAAGSLYFNSVSGIMKVYTGSIWVAAYVSAEGFVTLTGVETLTNKTLTDPTLADSTLLRAMFKDTGFTYYNSNSTNALDYVNGSHQRWAPATGAQTLSITNWPPTGNLGELLIEGVNLGASTITWPTINWVKSDGSFTTTFSGNGVTLQTSGTDWIILWTRDAGTTIYGKIVR